MMKTTTRFHAVYLAGLALALLAPLAQAGDLAARDAWVREAPPGAPVMAAYLTIENRGKQADRLVAVASTDFPQTEIHNMREQNGVLRMYAIDALPVPAGGQVTLAPGGLHLMLMKPRRALRAGDTVKLELRFASGARLTVDATVRRVESSGHRH
jgi:hypothetical protein